MVFVIFPIFFLFEFIIIKYEKGNFFLGFDKMMMSPTYYLIVIFEIRVNLIYIVILIISVISICILLMHETFIIKIIIII